MGFGGVEGQGRALWGSVGWGWGGMGSRMVFLLESSVRQSKTAKAEGALVIADGLFFALLGFCLWEFGHCGQPVWLVGDRAVVS